MSRIIIKKNYRDDKALRSSFNQLANKIFGLDFEDWYQNGYWTDKYNPYSVIVDGKVVSNVSVNITDFNCNGEIKHFIQLGTVMTDSEYRKLGYIRKIMEEIEKDYAGKVDGIYLFANDSVLEFYPKYGFKQVNEYQYIKKVSNSDDNTMEQVYMQDKEAWDKFEKIIQSSEHCCKFDMVNNSQLNMFYISKFMQNNVYYSKELDAYVVAEIKEDEVCIDMVVANKELEMDEIIKAFGRNIKKARLGFTPKNTRGFMAEIVNVDDCTLFIKGKVLEEIKENQIMFPVLSHA